MNFLPLVVLTTLAVGSFGQRYRQSSYQQYLKYNRRGLGASAGYDRDGVRGLDQARRAQPEAELLNTDLDYLDEVRRLYQARRAQPKAAMLKTNLASNTAPRWTLPWPVHQVEKGYMFILPTHLKLGDIIHITGMIIRPYPKGIYFNLLQSDECFPDYKNVPLQLEINIAEDKISAQSIYKNSTIPSLMPTDDKVSDYVPDLFSESHDNVILEVSFRLRQLGKPTIAVDIGSPDVKRVELENGVEHIRYLTIQSDDVESVIIEHMAFDFALDYSNEE